MINFNTIDLNLLKTLDVLLTEHNVTRAAERLHLSQPSVSVHLSKLRDLLHDPLLLPSSRGMKPTVLAESIRQPLRQALVSLEAALNTNLIFDPTQSERTWKLAGSDYAEFVAIQPTMHQLLQTSIQCRLSMIHMHPERLIRQLERGEIDLAFHLRDPSLAELKSKSLLTERYVLTGRRNHPALQTPIDLTTFCQLKQGIVSPYGGGFAGVTDTILQSLQMARNVVLSVPNFHFLIASLKQSDLVAMLPERLVCHDPELLVCEPPLALPSFELAMLWHERSHRDPAHQWLRQQFTKHVSEQANI
ncbi:LysR substrate-binding domain-containing protein [Celerinatantimonas sp. YJH-8]|uniref:LysR substrate-binding domain-containing protein n=1 Tax=Celerinatantimonas sp. YJH-8 TaxID=3228714 RepID=UPI0038BF9CEF